MGWLESWTRHPCGALAVPGLWAGADMPTPKLPLGKCWQLPLPGARGLVCHGPLRGSPFLTLFSLVHDSISGQNLWPLASPKAVVALQGASSRPFITAGALWVLEQRAVQRDKSWLLWCLGGPGWATILCPHVHENSVS